MDDKTEPTPQLNMKNHVRAKLGVNEETDVAKESPRDRNTGKFKKGVSGNPKGRPKKKLPHGVTWKELYSDKQFEVMDQLWKLINDKGTPAHVRLSAITEWNNRSLGRPKQTVEMESTVNQTTTTIDLSGIPVEQLKQMQALLAQGQAIDGVVEEDHPALPSADDRVE